MRIWLGDLKKKKWIIDLSLVFVIIVMGVFLFIELNRTFNFIRQNVNTADDIDSTALSVEEFVVSEHTNEQLNIFSGSHQNLQLMDLAGTPVSFSDYKGKAILINFWATWCPPCLEEMPLIEKYAVRHEDQLAVLAINAGERDDTVRDFVDEHGFSFDILLDPSNSAAKQFFVYGYPTTMFFDDQGYIQSTHIGELNEDLLVNYLTTIGIGE